MGDDSPNEPFSGTLKDDNVATLVQDCTSDAVDAAKSENSECQVKLFPASEEVLA